MLNLVWKIQTYSNFSLDQLFDVLQLRVNIFVVEQQCAYPELDECDRHAETRHLSGYDENGSLVAYARLLPAGISFSEVSVGRLVVRTDVRGQGVGHQLLQKTLDEAQKVWPGHVIRMAAQEYLESFYEHYGFRRVSDIFLDHGVPHVEMLKK
ncbi:MAG: GNAT family N-acetyltransferase [Nitrospirales bacterium]